MMQSQALAERAEFRRNVYVASLPLDFDDERLARLFAPYGRLSSARIMRMKGTRQSKGYGFVLYKNASSAELAVSSLVGHVIDGHRIQVRIAHPDASLLFSGQRGSKVISSEAGNPPPHTPPSPMILTPPPQALVSQAIDPSLLMTPYPVSTLYPSLYPSVFPSLWVLPQHPTYHVPFTLS